MSATRLVLASALLLAGCESKTSSPGGGGLTSDVPLRTTEYFVHHPSDLSKMEGICAEWKGSQRPPASWPAIVINNCNNADAAKGEVVRNRERDKLLKESGS